MKTYATCRVNWPLYKMTFSLVPHSTSTLNVDTTMQPMLKQVRPIINEIQTGYIPNHTYLPHTVSENKRAVT
jgi:hypothetical protein